MFVGGKSVVLVVRKKFVRRKIKLLMYYCIKLMFVYRWKFLYSFGYWFLEKLKFIKE